MICEIFGICCVNRDPEHGVLQVQSECRSCRAALVLGMGISVVSESICARAKGELRGCLAMRRFWT